MASYSSADIPGSSGMRPASHAAPEEFSIRVPKNNKKKYHVMRFNSNLSVDFVKWKTQNMQIKMERENNLKEFKGVDEELPKYGAGSEFGREQREEARRKKYGYVARKYKPEDQPWILKQGGKSGKKFKGIREGGVSDNTAYYIFTKADNGILEAYPLQEWYKFQPIQRYKALSAEEAELEFGRRNKIINYFSLMLKKRLRNEEDGDLEDPDEVKGKKGGSKKKDKELKISEMDDWIDSDDLSESDEEKKDDDDDEGPRNKGKKKGNKKGAAKKKKKDSDDEAVEESDDGDEEGRELDYISDSSESASDHEMKANKELKGVAEEDALRKLLNSESEDEDEENEEKKNEEVSNSEDEESKNKKENNEKDGNDKSKEESSKKKKPSKNNKKSKNKNDKKNNKKGDADSSSELSPNSTDSDSDNNFKNKPVKTEDATNSAGSSRSATPTPGPEGAKKRKLTSSELAVAAAKKAKLEQSSTPSGGGANTSSLYSESGITEEAIRRYLKRKPMTTTDLLKKFKKKTNRLTKEQMVNVMTQILKNINPVRQMIKNEMYLSLRPS